MEIIFVVDDDADICRLLQFQLGQAGYAVSAFDRAAPAFDKAQHSPPALFLLDIMIPGESGLDLCKRIRSTPQLDACKIIFVTAKTEETDRVLGLELGADDYITKPFSPREVLARIKAVLRRSAADTLPNVLAFGDVVVDLEAMSVTVGANKREISATEFRILKAFARSAGRVLSRARLLDLVWGGAEYVHQRSVDVYISRIRDKIEEDPEHPRYLRTVRGVGYCLDGVKSTRPTD
jgi:DNA-binding response OmpR family regulator